MGVKPNNDIAISMEHGNAPRRYDDIIKGGEISFSNGLSSFDDDKFDDAEAEIEAAAAMSETPMPVVLPKPAAFDKPLHVQVNGFTSSEQSTFSGGRTSSFDSSSSYSPAVNRPTVLTRSPTVRLTGGQDFIRQSPMSASSSSHDVMGPPSASTSINSMLSPAASFGVSHNGFGSKSTDLSPSSPAFRPRFSSHQIKRPSDRAHPLATFSSQPSTSQPSTSQPFSSQSRLPVPPHRLSQQQTPQQLAAAQQRREAESAKRKLFNDRIHAHREAKELRVVMPSFDEQTDNQMSVALRKFHKGGTAKELPNEVRHDVFGDDLAEVSEVTRRKLKEAKTDRRLNTMPDDLTDESDVEMSEPSTSKKIDANRFRWAEEKVRLGYQDARSGYYLETRKAELQMLNQELAYMNQTQSVMLEGDSEKNVDERRRTTTGIVWKCSVEAPREDTNDLGCARARALISYQKRRILRDVYKTEDTSIGGVPSKYSRVPPPLVRKWTNGMEKVEYEQVDEGAVDTKSSYCSETDADMFQLITPNDYKPFESRMLNYFHKVSTIPMFAIRRRVDQPIFVDAAEDEKTRNGLNRASMNREKKLAREESRRRQERKMLLSEIDEEDDDDDDGKARGSRRGRGRGRRGRPPRRGGNGGRSNASARSSRDTHSSDYYWADDGMGTGGNLPQKIAYARIPLPEWEIIEPTPLSNVTPFPDLVPLNVARCHHQLAYLERERNKLYSQREYARKHRSSAAQSKQAPLKPSSSIDGDEDLPRMADDEKLLQDMPPFDPANFYAPPKPVFRRFGNIEKPYPPRKFPLSPKR